MKKSLIITISLAAILLLSSFTWISHGNSDNSELSSARGGYYYLVLDGMVNRKTKNAALITKVFYSSEKPACSDFMNYANAHFPKFNYAAHGQGANRYCVWGSYKTKRKANRSRDKRIASLKRNDFRVIYTNFTGY